MKKPTAFLLLGFILIIFSCKKEKQINDDIDPEPIDQKDEAAVYSQLKVGNYWIYQEFEIDSSGNATPTSRFDSCYVRQDTIIHGNRFYELRFPINTSTRYIDWIRDSLDCIVRYTGEIIFSSKNFSNILSSQYYIDFSTKDTLLTFTTKMTDKNLLVTTPAGSYITLNARSTYVIFPPYNTYGKLRFAQKRYAANVGLVIETNPIYLASPGYTEKQLVRFHLN